MSGLSGNQGETLFGGDDVIEVASVVFNRPLDQPYSYRVPERLVGSVRPGQRLRVPLGRGNSATIGYCVAVTDQKADVSANPTGFDRSRLKDVIGVIDDPPLIDRSMLDLTKWLASYYACSWGQALDAVVPAGVKNQAGTRLRTCLTVPEEIRAAIPEGLPHKQAAALAVLIASTEPTGLDDVCRMAKCGPGTIALMRKRGLVLAVKRRVREDSETEADEPLNDEPERAVRPEPTVEQAEALAKIDPVLREGKFAVFLLHGVTGSGKTEVYLSAIERVVATGREAIVLVPEISLTPQTIRRFRRRFPRIAVLHSHLSDSERHRHWRSIAAGEIQVVVGARSAVFAPTRRLGLIVIDEEHETSFKQETVPRYHARDVAVMRGMKLGVPVILGSATPALETWRNAELGRYERIALEERVGARPMPHVTLIDMRHEKPDPEHPVGALSVPLRIAMTESLKAGGQVMLLLNRRGFHTYVLCPKCGGVLKCDQCDIALTHHKGRRKLICHGCDRETAPPSICPACRQSNLHYGGIGAERLERDVRLAFGDRVIQRMDSDTMRAPGSHERVLSEFRAGRVDVLLGTQMIAKGLDFPNVTLVGVINADTALHLPDFRAAERTFQLVAQVAGRTGRGDRPGRVLVQTYAPDHPAIAAAVNHDYLSFVAGELKIRRDQGVPPYGRMARLIARGEKELQVREYMNRLAESLRSAAAEGVRLLGPAPAPVLKIRGLFRFHLQLRAASARPLQDLLRSVLPENPAPRGIELATDVDPISML